MRKGAAPALHRAAGSRRRSGSLPGAGCFLRDAIQSANLDSNFGDCVGVGPYGNDLIVFDPSVATVTLTNTTPTPPDNDNNEYLDLDIRADTGSGALTVDGGSNGVTVQAGPAWGDRIFDIVPGPQPTFVVLRNLIVQGGSPPAAAVETGIGGPCFNSGGGVRNRSGGNLTLDTVIVQNNTMPMNGGGVCHQLGGVLTIQNSHVISNTAGRAGGGVWENAAQFTLQNSQVLSNTVNGLNGIGGGIVTQGGATPKTILTSTVAYNRADGDGGGIYNQTARGLQVSGSTVLSNTAGAFLNQPANGGGIWSGSRLNLNNTDVLSNAALISGTTMMALPFGGGGIYQQSQQVTINGGQVGYNVARSFVNINVAGGGVWNSGPNANLQNVAVVYNRAVRSPSTFAQAFGGGIYNAGPDVFIQSSQIADNQAMENGGGIYNAAGAFVVVIQSHALTNTAINGGGLYNMGGASVGNSVFGANQASQNGGGLYNAAAATGLNVFQSTFDGNSANDGGGVYNAGPANLSNSALVNNTASNGGGAYNTGVLESVNNTLSGNSAPDGSGLLNNLSGSAYLTHTTVASNTNAAGIRVAGGTVQVLASLVAYHTTGGDCSGSVTENGSSLSSDGTCGVIFSNINPLLQPLALNGGQTLNHALSPGSPALDVVPLPCAVGGDQRFVVRPQGTACDIGAFELEEADLEVSKSADPSPVIAGQTITYTVIVTNVSASGAANNVVLTDTLAGGATFGGVVSGGGFALQSSTSSQAIFTLSSLSAGMSATLVFTATAPASGPINNTATVASSNPDPVLSNNTASVTTPVTPAANLQIGKAVTTVTNVTGTVRPGGALTYTLLITNTGPSSASFITVTDSLPTGLTYVSATGAGWSCSFSAPTVTCTTSTLSVGAAPAIQIVATAPVTPGLALTNTASVTAATYPAATVNSNSVTVKVQYRVYAPIARKP